MQFPTHLRLDPGCDERSDEDREPDANHGQHAITDHPGRNRVFPSKELSFAREESGRFYKLLTRGKMITPSVPATR